MDIKYQTIIEKIRNNSSKGLISWTPGSYASTYYANIGNGSVSVFHDTEPDPMLPVGFPSPIGVIKFMNSRGEEFKSFQVFYTTDEDYELIRDMYDIAHNSYMMIDETLRSMIDDLDNTSISNNKA